MAVAGCINAYDCAGCYLTTLQQLQSDNIGVAINYTAPGEYGRRQLDYIKYTDKCGCTCCLTGENELRIVATQGVIKNFTLTNDDTNEVVNVKWNDLFGSNRAYTMVRYKTGSYPTSITDGTLAVKETTQNQYSVSGYNVSGLTDGTTYYFTAFAVSQDGTIIVVQNKTITAEFMEYKPSSNTMLYIPMKKDFLDYSGNNITITNTGATIVDNQATKGVGYLSLTSKVSGNFAISLSRNMQQTIVCRIKIISSDNRGKYFSQSTSTYGFGLGRSDQNVWGFTYSRVLDVYGSTAIGTEWCFMVFTKNNNNNILYKNNVIIASNSNLNYYSNTSNDFIIGNTGQVGIHMYISQFIVENRLWTETERVDFFNKTKATYGY